jgi:hypothetical protein
MVTVTVAEPNLAEINHQRESREADRTIEIENI